MRRYLVSPLSILPLILVGILAGTLVSAMAIFLNLVLGFGETASFFVGVAGVASLVVALWLYSSQPVDIKNR